MQVHNLLKLGEKKHRRIGRGGKRGSFSGRGIKGQKSRSGHRIRPQIRDVIKKIHKRRGYFMTSIKRKLQTLNLSDIEKNFKDGEKVTPKILIEKGLIRVAKSKPKIKILGMGKLTKKVTFDKNIIFSKSAKTNVE
ncbi:uL15 family ribosomal protein [Candidatus Giovannonibacteria bacterium]|nr:uL15 family ribosomal protein [Candidatus Giovannonibacteria bacterium]